MNGTFSLTGDPELDACLPTMPRVLPEIMWIPLSSRLVLASGSLDATLVPSRIGDTSLFDLMSLLDGNSTLAEVIEGSGSDAEERRKYVRMLFSAGLLEEASDSSFKDIAAFHALAMDQTRLHNDRTASLCHSRRPVLLCAAPPLLANALADAGLNLSTDTRAHNLAFQLLVLNPDATPYRPDLVFQNDVPRLPLRLHGSFIDIGPWLPPKSGCQLRDLQGQIDSYAGEVPVCADDQRLLYVLAAHAVYLVVAGLSPIIMASTAQRIRLDYGGPLTEELPVSTVLSDMTVGVTLRLASRLASRARSAMPSLRHVGCKAHEVHYAPRNIHAALEIQEAGQDPVSILPSLESTNSARLLRILSAAFGYGEEGGKLRRRCPTGGNLGSPEPLLWTVADGWMRVYRYLPVIGQLESVGNARIDAQAKSQIGVVCLGNHEKAARKYGDFGRTLIHLDGGVARGVFLDAAMGEGFHCLLGLDFLDTYPSLSKLLDARNSYYTTLWGATLALPSGMAYLSPRRRRIRHQLPLLLAMRRAQRQFDGAGTSPEHFVRLVRKARPSEVRTSEAELLPEVKVVLRVREGCAVRWFYLHSDNRLEHIAGACGGQELFLQREFDKAPFALFFLVSLAPLLERHGEGVLDSLLLLCGQWVGNLWLSLGSEGLGGCPCGAAVESDVQASLSEFFKRDSLLFSFVAGALLR